MLLYGARRAEPLDPIDRLPDLLVMTEAQPMSSRIFRRYLQERLVLNFGGVEEEAEVFVGEEGVWGLGGEVGASLRVRWLTVTGWSSALRGARSAIGRSKASRRSDGHGANGPPHQSRCAPCKDKRKHSDRERYPDLSHSQHSLFTADQIRDTAESSTHIFHVNTDAPGVALDSLASKEGQLASSRSLEAAYDRQKACGKSTSGVIRALR